MIIKEGKNVIARYKNNKTITDIYKGNHLIWEYIISCFGGGYWNNDKPWNNDSVWKSV